MKKINVMSLLFCGILLSSCNNATIGDLWSDVPVVKYDINGGGGSVQAAEMLDVGSEISIAESPGDFVFCTFRNWNTAADGSGDPYAPGDTYTVRRNVTFYAQWDFSYCHVTFSVNGVGGIPQPQTVRVLKGESVTVPSLDDSGSPVYKFANWNIQSDGLGEETKNPDEVFIPETDIVYYATYTYAGLSVHYHVNELNDAAAPATQESAIGETITVAPEIESQYYEFAGWNTQSGGTGLSFQPGDTITVTNENAAQYGILEDHGPAGTVRGMWLYAQKGAPKKFTVNYDFNLDEGVDASGLVLPASVTDDYQKTFTVAEPPLGLANGENIFLGWMSKGEADKLTADAESGGAANNSGGQQTDPTDGAKVYTPGSLYTILGNDTLLAKWQSPQSKKSCCKNPCNKKNEDNVPKSPSLLYTRVGEGESATYTQILDPFAPYTLDLAFSWLGKYAEDNTEYVIRLENDEESSPHIISAGTITNDAGPLSAPLNISIEVNTDTVELTDESGAPTPFIISLKGSNPLFDVKDGFQLTLDDNVQITGDVRISEPSGTGENRGGKLLMQADSSITGNVSIVYDGSPIENSSSITMQDNAGVSGPSFIVYSGLVNLKGNALIASPLTINGGTLSMQETSRVQFTANQVVNLWPAGTLILNDSAVIAKSNPVYLNKTDIGAKLTIGSTLSPEANTAAGSPAESAWLTNAGFDSGQILLKNLDGMSYLADNYSKFGLVPTNDGYVWQLKNDGGITRNSGETE
ncbi:MAG: InlB B-repeat-containing protein [Spirochaetaceae bacterium]|jgi:hypothetical protein|nr:InlB B-repeat-containing protein [Spirochaetaceae bacterium]